MASTFRGLESGKSGINVAMLNLEVAGQNIANANSAGYTRQRIVSTAKTPPGSAYVISQVYNKMVGQGATVTEIQQIRSEYLDQQFRNLNSSYNYYEYRSQGTTYLSGVMNELNTDASITICLDNFSNALSKLAEDPSSEEYRLNLQQCGVALTETTKYVYGEMVDLCGYQNESVSSTAQSINAIAEQLAALNTSIANYERSGASANELRDQRNLLLDNLSGLVNIEYAVNAENPCMLDISIGGNALVSGSDFNTIQISKSSVANEISGVCSYELTLDGARLQTKYTDELGGGNITGGKLYAHMELLENSTSANAGVPYYISELNRFVQSIAKTINEVHTGGFTYPDAENGDKSISGTNFFDVPTETVVDASGVPTQTENYSLINGGNFLLSTAVLDSVWNIAASSGKVDLNADTTNTGNAEKILEMQAAFESGKIYDTLNTFVSHLAITTDSCGKLLDTSESLLKSVDSQRDSLSAVSLDEEATNLIMFKQCYNASSRLISTIDDMLDKLINGTGRVGL